MILIIIALLLFLKLSPSYSNTLLSHRNTSIKSCSFMQINGRKNTLPHAQTHFKIKSLGCCDLSDYLLFRLLSRARISLYHHFEFCQSSPLQCVCMYVCWGIGGGGVSPITVLWWQSVKLSQPYDRGCEGLKKKNTALRQCRRQHWKNTPQLEVGKGKKEKEQNCYQMRWYIHLQG